MSEVRTYPMPSWTAVVAEQFRAVGIAIRREMALFGIVLLLGTSMVVLAWIRVSGSPNADGRIPLDLEIALPLVLGGVLVPLAVWKDLGPSRRGYHWAMPVSRVGHDLARTAVGWVWYLLALAVFLLWIIGISVATGGIDHPSHTPPLAWQWLVPIAAATVMYLFGTAIALSTDHPWRSLAGIVIGFLVLVALVGSAGWQTGMNTLQSVLDGRWGLGTLTSGTVSVPEEATLQDGRVMTIYRAHPDLGAWLGATLLWLSLAVACVSVAVTRYQER